jgi:predicted Zn-dependent peptidase
MMGPAFWGDHPLGRSILGSRENILGFDSRPLEGFSKNFTSLTELSSPLPEMWNTTSFGRTGWPRLFQHRSRQRPLPRENRPPFRAASNCKHRDLEQTHLYWPARGFGDRSRRFAASLLNTILGGNMSSRLFQIIREERGLAYSIYSFLTSYADTGMFGVYTAVDAGCVRNQHRVDHGTDTAIERRAGVLRMC